MFIAGGANHFIAPAVYLSIMPGYLPWHSQFVAVSGVAEIMGGIGILPLLTRRLAGWGLIALLIAVFPANIEGALRGMAIAGHPVPQLLLWLRLPLQLLLIAWVYFAAARPPRSSFNLGRSRE